VIGAGLFGAYCAEKLYRAGAATGLRIVVLDVFPGHVQKPSAAARRHRRRPRQRTQA
jgi:flavin-dependent dehydrogenase